MDILQALLVHFGFWHALVSAAIGAFMACGSLAAFMLLAESIFD